MLLSMENVTKLVTKDERGDLVCESIIQKTTTQKSYFQKK